MLKSLYRTHVPAFRRLIRQHHWRLAVGLLLAASLLYAHLEQPVTLVSTANLPDNNHQVTLSIERQIAQRIHAPSRYLSAIAWYVDPTSLPTDDTPLTLHVRDPHTTTTYATVTTTVGAALHNLNNPVDITGSRIGLDGTVLHIPFPTNLVNHNQPLDLILSTPSERGLRLRVQIDDTKYPDGFAIYNNEPQQRDLGFVLGEQPPLTVTAIRWLTNDHPSALIGISLAALALLYLLWPHRQPWHPSSGAPYTHYLHQFTPARLALLAVGITMTILTIYWPATEIGFFQDDIPKLLRARELGDHPLTLFFTNQRYAPPGHTPSAPMTFYRPLSFSMYPWLLYHLFGLNSFIYHLLSLFILSGITLGITILSYILLRSLPLALVAAGVFAVHSTKIPAVFWWSSTEDLLATAFLILTLITYLYYRARPTTQRYLLLCGSFILALLSKEHTLLAIPLLILLDLITQQLPRSRPHALSYLRRLAPLLLLSGLFLLARAVALDNPTLPRYSDTDSSYNLSLNPRHIITNTIPYAAWTVENWLWPSVDDPHWLAQATSHIGAEPPYYPALLLAAAWAIILTLAWRTPYRRPLIFATLWWPLTLIPPLFLTAAWGSRWLTLATWSLGLGLASAIGLISAPRRRHATILSVLVILGIYGMWMTRQPSPTFLYRELSAAAQSAIADLDRQGHHLTPDTTIYFIDVAPGLRGTVNANLFRLLRPDAPFQKTTYRDELPDYFPHQAIPVTLSLPQQ